MATVKLPVHGSGQKIKKFGSFFKCVFGILVDIVSSGYACNIAASKISLATPYHCVPKGNKH